MVLKPTLFRRLESRFGKVKVANEGAALDVSPSVDALTGRPRLTFVENGEYYAICCPYCGDTRHRLSVSYRWGEEDPHGREMRFLVRCFNEDCLKDPGNYRDFQERMDAIVTGFTEAARAARPAAPRPPASLPGRCVPADALPATHPAVAYLLARGYDPAELWRKYHASVCVESRFTLARGRVVLPVFAEGRLVSWQARYPGELDWKATGIPKFWTNPNYPIGRYLYNYDRARLWRTGVVVEGGTGAWRFGSMSLATFGKDVNATRVRLLRRAFGGPGCSCVLLHDPEERETEQTARNLERLYAALGRKHFAAVWLPEGTDPGSQDRAFLRAYVREEAARQGVKVAYALKGAGEPTAPAGEAEGAEGAEEDEEALSW